MPGSRGARSTSARPSGRAERSGAGTGAEPRRAERAPSESARAERRAIREERRRAGRAVARSATSPCQGRRARTSSTGVRGGHPAAPLRRCGRPRASRSHRGRGAAALLDHVGRGRRRLRRRRRRRHLPRTPRVAGAAPAGPRRDGSSTPASASGASTATAAPPMTWMAAAFRTSTARSGADAGRASRRISSGSTRPGWPHARPRGRSRCGAARPRTRGGVPRRGRGRARDLFVGQETERMDGLPSDNRVYLRTAPARFERGRGLGHRLRASRRGPSPPATWMPTADRPPPRLFGRARAAGDGRRAPLPQRRRTVPRRHRARAHPVDRRVGRRARPTRRGRSSRPHPAVGVADPHLAEARRRLPGRVRAAHRAAASRSPSGTRTATAELDIFVAAPEGPARRRRRPAARAEGGRDWRAIRVPSRHGGVADDVYPIDYDATGSPTSSCSTARARRPGPVQLIGVLPD